MPLQIPLEYKVLGYEAETFPGLTLYAPPLMEQPLMAGAQEELPEQYPSGILSASEADSASVMPESCRQMPYVALEVANRCVWEGRYGCGWAEDRGEV